MKKYYIYGNCQARPLSLALNESSSWRSEYELIKPISCFAAKHSDRVINYLKKKAITNILDLKNKLILDLREKAKIEPIQISNIPDRDVRKWGKKVFWHKTLENFNTLNSLSSGIHSFAYNGVFYDFLIENNNTKKSIFYFYQNTIDVDEEILEKANLIYISSLPIDNQKTSLDYKDKIIIGCIEKIINIFKSKNNVIIKTLKNSFATYSSNDVINNIILKQSYKE